jgi:ATP-binding protein involved in chromosome partitioning
MGIDRESIRVALTRVPHPNLGQDVVTANAVSKISYCDGYASVRIAAGGLHDDQRRGLTQQLAAAIRLHAHQAGVEIADVHVEMSDERPPPAPLPPSGAGGTPAPRDHKAGASPAASNPLPGVKHIIAVGAGKGGVGKSTVSVNLAVGLARRGHAVGLMDGDIYGPSLPTMLGLSALDAVVRGSMIEPFAVHGIKAMTIGKLVDPEKPLVWRGPMAHGAFKQLVEQTNWGELDYLVIDLPPGTGDVSLTLAQLLKVTGAVVVCTPQKVAQDDAVRAARMFQQLHIEVLGVVENMSYFTADDGKEYDIFGRGGAQMMAQRLGVPFLGAVPINMALREHSDDGNPTANFTDRSARNATTADALERLVTNLEAQVALASIRSGAGAPTLTIN